MEFLAWFRAEWFQVLQTLSIVSGLLYTAYTVRVDGKSRKVENLLSVTASHREIWSSLYKRPELSRVLLSVLDLKLHPVTQEEELFIHLVFLHMSATYKAINEKLFVKPEGLEKDIGMMLALPIPNAVWKKLKEFYDGDFVAFVESCTRLHPPGSDLPFSVR